MKKKLLFLSLAIVFHTGTSLFGMGDYPDSTGEIHATSIPRSLNSYNDTGDGLFQIIKNRALAEPFNVAATLIFFLAIVHTFLSPRFTALAHRLEKRHKRKLETRQARKIQKYEGEFFDEVHFGAHISLFLGEVEAIFGIWSLVLTAAVVYFFNWETMVNYISEKVNFTEPMFVVTIMALASSRPVMKFSENCMQALAKIGGLRPAAWWFTILTVGPLLGSFITEPGAMTISALLLGKQFYDLKPGKNFSYATIGLLFVNVSVGGTLSHFAAPPVLMVAGKWGWDFSFMLTHIGWRAIIGIVINNILYFTIFSREFQKLKKRTKAENIAISWKDRPHSVPFWITLVHILFMVWTVFNAHHPVLFIGGYLFYLGFAQATIHHQNRNDLRSPLMVGFFLAGLVIHGGLQGWWIAPILGHLAETPLMIGASILTSFNDNAAITYLSSLVPDLTDKMKYAIMVGAVTGGGLTVIANAPNPAGQSILSHYFENGVVSPIKLAGAALIPTIIVGFCFMLL